MRVAPTNVAWDKIIPEATNKNPEASSASSFAQELKAKLHEVDHFQQRADEAMQEGAVKGAENIHETMIRLEEADLSVRLLMKVRNKALDAYQEIMRMQI